MALTTRKRRRRRAAPRRAVRRTRRAVSRSFRRASKKKKSVTGLLALGLLAIPAIQAFQQGTTIADKFELIKRSYSGFDESGKFDLGRLFQVWGPPLIPIAVVVAAKFILGSQRIGQITQGTPLSL